MNMLEQLLLDASLRKQGVDPSVLTPATAPAPPSGFEVLDPALAVDAAAPVEAPPLPPGFMPMNPDGSLVDNSSLMGDLTKGVKQVQNAGTMAEIMIQSGLARGNRTMAEAPDVQIAAVDKDIIDLQNFIAENRNVPGFYEQGVEDLKILLAKRRSFETLGQSPMMADYSADQIATADARDKIIYSELVPEMAVRSAEAAAIPSNPYWDTANAGTGEGNWADTKNYLSNFAQDPSGMLRSGFAQSAANMAPVLAAGAVGGPVAAGGAGAGIEALSYSSQGVLTALQKTGVDTSDPAAVQEFFQTHEAELGELYRKGFTRGGIIGGMDALSMGITGRLVDGAMATGGFKTKAGAVLGGGMAEILTEGAGEALAGTATDGFSAKDVLAEMTGAAGPGMAQTGAHLATESAHAALGAARARKANSAPATATPALPEGFVPLDPAQEQPPVPTTADAAPALPEGFIPLDPTTAQVEPTTAQVEPGPDAGPVEAPTSPPASTSAPADEASAPEAAPLTPARPTGKREKVVTPNRELEFDTEFQVVEADSLKAAQGEEQPRDRANREGATQDQINHIRNNFDPLGLMGSRESDRGAPIVAEDDTILSGNGRVATMHNIYDGHPEHAATYNQALTAAGYDTSGFTKPVLIRRAAGLTPEQRALIGQKSNVTSGQELSPGERAMQDQKNVTPDMAGLLDGEANDGLNASSNQPFVSAFMATLPAGERNAMQDRDGKLTDHGQRRIAAALFAHAYGDKTLVESGIEQGNDKSITNALLAASPAWSQMRAALGSQKAEQLDPTPLLVKGLKTFQDLRGKGLTVDDYAAQNDAFNPVDQDAVAAARIFANADGNRLASQVEIARRIKAVAAKAGDVAKGGGGDLFGDGPKSAAEIVRHVMGVPNPKAEAKPAPKPMAMAAADKSGPKDFKGVSVAADAMSKAPVLDVVGKRPDLYSLKAQGKTVPTLTKETLMGFLRKAQAHPGQAFNMGTLNGKLDGLIHYLKDLAPDAD